MLAGAIINCSVAWPLLRYALLETDGAPAVLATLQVFTRRFVEALEKEKQVRSTACSSHSPGAKGLLLGASG